MSYLGENIPKLGFGLMRLPMIKNEVDIEQTKQMVDLFMQKGFSYFDTAFGYLNGKSEEAAKTALVDRYPREQFQLATKLPAWIGAKNAEEAKNMFWISLKRTNAEYFDFYLLHNLGGKRTEVFEKFGIWDFLAEQKEKGKIKHLGFSSHAKAEQLDEILTKHPEAEFVQTQINYADWEDDSVEARKCYEVARKHGKPVIVMEPVKGGALAKLPEVAAKVFSRENPTVSSASWALRFAADLEGIITVLSGMSTLEQMKDNISVMEHFKPLTEHERSVIKEVQTILASIPHVPCTDCQYCLKACPNNIAIPGILGTVNDYLIYNDLARSRGLYGWETLVTKASDCIACKACEEVCPQNIPIANELSKAAKLFE